MIRRQRNHSDHASAEQAEDAWMDAAIAEHEAWKAAGCPGGTIPHEIVAAELCGDGQPMTQEEAMAMRGAHAIAEIPDDTGP